jgi:phage terminase large subunit GpA-like protein
VSQVHAASLADRAEDYPAQVPRGVALLTAGVDVQTGSNGAGRLEIETVGWGRDDESWSIEHQVIEGDLAKPEIWDDLDRYLMKTFQHESGHGIFIKGACIDSGGHHTNAVYRFCVPRIRRNVWAVKGSSERASGTWSPVWPARTFESKATKHKGYRPIIVGVNAAKESIYNSFSVKEPGPGFAHFPTGRVRAYFDQLAAEEIVTETIQGFATRRWHLKGGRRNEALDLRVYAFAALQGLAAAGLNVDRLASIVVATPARTSPPVVATVGVPSAARVPALPPAAFQARPPVRRMRLAPNQGYGDW